MAPDLETVRKEVHEFLKESDLAVFFGFRQMVDAINQVSWDVDSYPDFRDFLASGQQAGARLFVFSQRAFSLDQIDEALDQVEDSNLGREEKRSFETRLRQLQAYEGFTCSLELSFSLENDVYTFELHTDWYGAMNQILAELDAIADEEDSGPDDTLGGYFSKN